MKKPGSTLFCPLFSSLLNSYFGITYLSKTKIMAVEMRSSKVEVTEWWSQMRSQSGGAKT